MTLGLKKNSNKTMVVPQKRELKYLEIRPAHIGVISENAQNVITVGRRLVGKYYSIMVRTVGTIFQTDKAIMKTVQIDLDKIQRLVSIDITGADNGILSYRNYETCQLQVHCAWRIAESSLLNYPQERINREKGNALQQKFSNKNK